MHRLIRFEGVHGSDKNSVTEVHVCTSTTEVHVCTSTLLQPFGLECGELHTALGAVYTSTRHMHVRFRISTGCHNYMHMHVIAF